jgi:hypothetical protein
MRHRLTDIIDRALDQTRVGGEPVNAVALALVAIAIAIDEAGDNITTAIERESR